jgi:hypothetical protein
MKCRDCKHYEPGDETSDGRVGRCLRQRWDHPQHGSVYGVAFANEGSDDPNDLDCDMAEARAKEDGRHGG